MIKSVLLSNQFGVDLNLVLSDPYEVGIIVKNITGLGYPKISVQNQSIPSSNIGIYQHSKIESRNIVLTLSVIGSESVEKSRRLVYDVLIVGMLIYIEIVTDEKTLHTFGCVESVEPDIFSEEEQLQVSIICPDPFLYTGGKVKYELKNLIGINNFQFSKRQQSNWFDFVSGPGAPRAAKPVSIIENHLDSSNKPYSVVTVQSRYENPKGFELKIENVDYSDTRMAFNEFIIEYMDGYIQFTGNNIDIFDSPVSSNYFFNSMLIIANDINNQKIIKRFFNDDGTFKDTDITNDIKLIVHGDYPTLKIGSNFFKVKTYGLVLKETTKPIAQSGLTNWGPVNSFNRGMWGPLEINYRSEFIVIDIYVESASLNDVDKKHILDNTITNSRSHIFICQLKLTTDEMDQKLSDNGSFKYRFFDYPNDKYWFGIRVDRSSNEKEPSYDINYSSGWVKGYANYWYAISCATCESIYLETTYPTSHSKKIKIDITKTNVVKDYLYYLLYVGLSEPSASGRHFNFYFTYNYYAERVIEPDGHIWYNREYINNSTDINIIVEHDEIVEGL